MAVPTKYNPSYSYSGFESVSPASPKPGAQLDNDFAQIEQSIDETIDALSQVRAASVSPWAAAIIPAWYA